MHRAADSFHSHASTLSSWCFDDLPDVGPRSRVMLPHTYWDLAVFNIISRKKYHRLTIIFLDCQYEYGDSQYRPTADSRSRLYSTKHPYVISIMNFPHNLPYICSVLFTVICSIYCHKHLRKSSDLVLSTKLFNIEFNVLLNFSTNPSLWGLRGIVLVFLIIIFLIFFI